MRTATDDAAVADLYPAAPAPPGAGMEGPSTPAAAGLDVFVFRELSAAKFR